MPQRDFSQADRRTSMVFQDQHGDRYTAMVEKDTMQACGPISPWLVSPLPVPEKYFKPVLGAPTRLHIDYEQWVADLEKAWEEYDQEIMRAATEMYKDGAAAAIADPPEALLRRVRGKGMARQPIEPVKQRALGDPWLRGLPGAVMPEEAAQYFPKPLESTVQRWSPAVDAPKVDFPIYVAPVWVCQDGRKFDAFEDAEAHQASLGSVLLSA